MSKHDHESKATIGRGWRALGSAVALAIFATSFVVPSAEIAQEGAHRSRRPDSWSSRRRTTHSRDTLPEYVKAEGLNAVDNVDAATLSATTLADHDVVILGEMPLVRLR